MCFPSPLLFFPPMSHCPKCDHFTHHFSTPPLFWPSSRFVLFDPKNVLSPWFFSYRSSLLFQFPALIPLVGLSPPEFVLFDPPQLTLLFQVFWLHSPQTLPSRHLVFFPFFALSNSDKNKVLFFYNPPNSKNPNTLLLCVFPFLWRGVVVSVVCSKLL